MRLCNIYVCSLVTDLYHGDLSEQCVRTKLLTGRSNRPHLVSVPNTRYVYPHKLW